LPQGADLKIAPPGKRIKQHWRGKFIFNRESHVLYRYAYTKRQAWLLMCKEIARRHDVIVSMVTNYFNESKDNHIIEIETEWREDE